MDGEDPWGFFEHASPIRYPAECPETTLAQSTSLSSSDRSDRSSSLSVADPVKRLKASQIVPECIPS